MCVAVQGKGGSGVAQVALYGLNIVPSSNGVHGVCMAGVVEADALQPGGGGDTVKLVAYRPSGPPASLVNTRPCGLSQMGPARS